jgi:DNA polymerase III delta prime subunit
MLDLRTTADAPLRDRLLALDAEIADRDATIADRESALNAIIYRLYGLTREAIAMVEGGCWCV